MNQNDRIELSREELYDRVWTQPMRELSLEFGWSDVGLRKLCHRNGIPTPPQGYHLMKDGLRKKRLMIPLPSIKMDQEETFDFKKKSFTTKTGTPLGIQAEWDKLISTPVNGVTRQQIKEINNVLKLIKSPLDLRRSDERGILITPSVRHPIRVSPAMFPKATETLKKIFIRFVELGANTPEYDNSEPRYPKLTIQWEDHEFGFRIEESGQRVKIPLSERPKRPGPLELRLGIKQWKSVPTNQLKLEVSQPSHGFINMFEGKSEIIDRIDDLAKRMFTAATEETEKNRIEALRKSKALVYLRQKGELRRKNEFEVLCQKNLLRESRQWRRSVELRTYLDAIEL